MKPRFSLSKPRFSSQIHEFSPSFKKVIWLGERNIVHKVDVACLHQVFQADQNQVMWVFSPSPPSLDGSSTTIPTIGSTKPETAAALRTLFPVSYGAPFGSSCLPTCVEITNISHIWSTFSHSFNTMTTEQLTLTSSHTIGKTFWKLVNTVILFKI